MRSGCFLVEGRRLLREVLASDLTVDTVLVDVATNPLDESDASVISERRISLVELSPAAFASVSDTVTSQGVAAVAKIPLRPERETTPSPIQVAFDGVADPGNLGTLLRSAEAFGVTSVCCGTGTVDPYSPKVVRASMGGLFHLSVSMEPTRDYVLRFLEEHEDGQVAAASADAKIPCHEVDFGKPTLILIGSEASGISDEVAQLATVSVRIPMVGRAESLNAAMAGSILLYEAHRQRLP